MGGQLSARGQKWLPEKLSAPEKAIQIAPTTQVEPRREARRPDHRNLLPEQGFRSLRLILGEGGEKRSGGLVPAVVFAKIPADTESLKGAIRFWMTHTDSE